MWPSELSRSPLPQLPTKLTRDQITGFWAAWTGWTLDGMDSVIYALVLSPALTELLPKSGMSNAPANVAFAGSILFALFLIGWGLAFIWGPIADRFGRTRVLAATILVFAVFTGAAALSQNVWQLAIFRLLAGMGIGGEWALAGTYVAEAWPEDRRKMGAGYLQTGYYAGFFLAAALNFTVGAHFGWRAMFLCGLAPVIVSLLIILRVKEPERWQRAAKIAPIRRRSPLGEIFRGQYLRRTLVNTGLLTVAIIGLWAAAVYEPTAIITLARKAGASLPAAVRMASLGTGLLSIGTILGCLALPPLAERFGRKRTCFLLRGHGECNSAHLRLGLLSVARALSVHRLAVLSRIFRRKFHDVQLVAARAVRHLGPRDGFCFCNVVRPLHRCGVNFAMGALVRNMGTLGKPVALTAFAFGIGLLLIPFSLETRGKPLPD